MAVWTLRQIDQVSALRQRIMVDHQYIARARVDVLDETRHQMARRLRDAAHTFGVDLDERDVQTVEEDAGRHLAVTARWWPSTLEVELLGGERDGEVLAVRGAPQHPLAFAAAMSPGWSRAAADAADPSEITTSTVTFDLRGWNETARRWVYAQAC